MTWFGARLGVYAAHCQLTDSIIRRAWRVTASSGGLVYGKKAASGWD
jgi:hypothetical protein